jgi:hypothetical protein
MRGLPVSGRQILLLEKAVRKGRLFFGFTQSPVDAPHLDAIAAAGVICRQG